MSKDIIVEVRIRYDELVDKDELQMLHLFSDRSTDAIKRKIVDAAAHRFLENMPPLDIDLSDIKERVKERIIDRKVDEVLE